MINVFSSPHALLDNPVLQWQQYQQTQLLKLNLNNILQCSSSFPPKNSKTEPINTNKVNPKTEVQNNLSVNSPFTNGCKKANTTKAIAKLINPFPSSLATFLNRIPIIIKHAKELARW